MPIPMLAGLAVSAVPSIFKMIQGGIQMGKAKRMNVERPIYQTPAEVKETTGMFRQLAGTNRLAGQTNAENKISQSTSNAIRNIENAGGSSSQILNTIAGLDANEKNAMLNLQVQGAQNQMNNQSKLGQQLGVQAGYKDKEFDYNKNQPFQDASATRSALYGAGMQNLMGGLDGLAGSATQALGTNAFEGIGGGIFKKLAQQRAMNRMFQQVQPNVLPAQLPNSYLGYS